MIVFKACIALFGVKIVDIGTHSCPKFLTSKHLTNVSFQSLCAETRFGHSKSYISLFAPKNINIAPK